VTTEPVRVLMTADTIGGVWTYSLELAHALGELGADVTLATMGRPVSPAQAQAAAAIPNLELVESRFALEWMPDPWRDVDAAGDWLLSIAQRIAPDVVHVNGYAHAALPFAAPVISVAHSCVWTWFRAVRGTDPDASWSEYRRRVRDGLQAARAVVAPTAAILRAILEAYRVAVPGRVIANGRDARCWRPAEKQPLVLSAGRLWDEAKGIAALVACADRVDWPIRIAGATDGPHGGGGTPAPAAVRWLGELAPGELAAWMARAAVYALPARYEPFGLSVLEAALAGCALIVGDLETLREIWRDAAVYVPPADPDALAAALRGLIRDPGRRGRLAAAARDRAQALSPARMATGYRALYDELIATEVRP
jgi:glycosyltransferase involved in cell wall biosynthesis